MSASARETACVDTLHHIELLLAAVTQVERLGDALVCNRLLQLTQADGAAVVFEAQITTLGQVPAPGAILELIAKLSEGKRSEPLSSARFVELGVDGGAVDSVLAGSIAASQQGHVLWFRTDASAANHQAPWSALHLAAAKLLCAALELAVRQRSDAVSALNEELVESARLKDLFLATIGHELRTPLNAMVGWLQLLRSGRLAGDKAEHALAVVERNARMQGRLIEDLLDASRISSAKLPLQVEPVDLASVVESALEAVTLSAEARNIRVHTQLRSRSSWVMGDSRRLHQVVWNLLSNAIKFTAKGGQVWLELTQAEGEVELSVRDDGEGISAQFLPHVFESFRQADASLAKARKGLGLGLAIVKHLAELHGGHVTAESAGLGHGATFRVRLPMAAPGTGPKQEPVQGSVHAAELAGLEVVLVEDDADSMTFLRHLLEGEGLKVHAFSSGHHALQALLTLKPDLIISDIGLPELDGYHFLEELRRRPAEQGGATIAIALTAHTQLKDRTRALLAGFQWHVPKPVDHAELFDVIRSLLRRPRIET